MPPPERLSDLMTHISDTSDDRGHGLLAVLLRLWDHVSNSIGPLVRPRNAFSTDLLALRLLCTNGRLNDRSPGLLHTHDITDQCSPMSKQQADA